MTWSALIPGLREIRGPLLAGYLWMLAIWLSLGERLPDDQSDAVFERLWEAGGAIGPVGQAAAASVVAYLIGALVSGAFRGFLGYLWAKTKLFALRDLSLSSAQGEVSGEWIPIQAILEVPSGNWEAFASSRLPKKGATRTMVDLNEAELSGALAGLKGAIKHAQAVSKGSAKCKIVGRRNGALVIAIPRPDQDLVELTVPEFSPSRDIWFKRALLETRLRELVPSTASKIEQLDYEAEFRESLAPPLIAVILVIASQASWYWAALLIVPFALLVQAVALRDAAGKELLDALRARSRTQELEKITPVFAAYRSDAKRLEKALIEANWENLRYLEEVVDEGLEQESPALRSP